MPGSDVNLGQYSLKPVSKTDDPAGLIIEIIRLAAGTTNTIYGAAHASAGSDDCKFISTILGGMAMPEADDADHTLAIVSTSTTTDDTLTVTSVASVAKTIWVFGLGQKS